MGFRFHKAFRLLPGVKANLSKSGLSASLGTRGAGINIGRRGVTTNAGIPGSGLSYRSKVGGRGGRLGILLLLAAAGWWAYQHRDQITAFIAGL